MEMTSIMWCKIQQNNRTLTFLLLYLYLIHLTGHLDIRVFAHISVHGSCTETCRLREGEKRQFMFLAVQIFTWSVSIILNPVKVLK